MSDRDAFLRAILAEPDDDAPRLVFADWLDEHSEPARAEFIRVQCERALADEDSPRRTYCGVRAGVLLKAHGRAWVRGLVADDPDWAKPGRWHRGFPAETTFSATPFANLFTPTMHELFPDIRLELPRITASADPVDRFASIVGDFRLRQVCSLDVDGSSRTAQLLYHAPHFDRVRSLTLRDSAPEMFGLADLAGSPLAERLKVLHVTCVDGYDLGTARVAAELLAREPVWAGLELLYISGRDADTAVETLVASETLSRTLQVEFPFDDLSARSRRLLRMRFSEYD